MKILFMEITLFYLQDINLSGLKVFYLQEKTLDFLFLDEENKKLTKEDAFIEWKNIVKLIVE